MTRGTYTSHWEGGQGCRNKVKMSRYLITLRFLFYGISFSFLFLSFFLKKKKISDFKKFKVLFSFLFRNDRQKYANSNKTVSRKAAAEKK